MIIRINENTKNERVIGELFPEKHFFSKRVQKSKHLFKMLDAWGIDGNFFSDVLLPNNYDIFVTDVEEGKIYKISAAKFSAEGKYYHFKDDNTDNKAQIFCSRRHFETRDL